MPEREVTPIELRQFYDDATALLMDPHAEPTIGVNGEPIDPVTALMQNQDIPLSTITGNIGTYISDSETIE